MAEVLITRPFYPSAMAHLEAEAVTHRLFEAADRDAFLREVGPRITAVIASAADAAFFEPFPNLELLASTAVGYENIDVAAAVERGVIVTNTPDVLTDAVADLAVGLLIALERRIVASDRFVRSGKWTAGGFPLARNLGDLTLGIVGLGRIGTAVAKRVEAFGVAVQYCNRNARADVTYAYCPNIIELAQTSDVLMCVVPGGEGTRQLITEEVMRALGPEGTLINIARGSVVDEAALVRCLQEGALGAAALDVFEREPNVPPELFAMDNVVLTPHIGSATESTRAAMGELAVRNVLEHLAGRPVVTPVPECVVLLAR
jgi:lactate dehydrogenase-like 2-hydroxyacid dehydrogenase